MQKIKSPLQYSTKMNKTTKQFRNASTSMNPVCMHMQIEHRFSVPEIVHVNRIIKMFFDIIEGEVKIIKCSKS